MTATLTATGTYKGKTADEWRALAQQRRDASRESFERSDTDGFLSQWALDMTARQYDLSAQLADTDGLTEVEALFDLDGNLVNAYHGWGRYGDYWMILDASGTKTGEYFNPSKARSDTAARKNNAAKGYYVGTAKVPGKATIVSGGTGLSGAASSYAAIVAADQGNVTKETVVQVVDNGR